MLVSALLPGTTLEWVAAHLGLVDGRPPSRPLRGSSVIEPGDRVYVLIPQGMRGAIDDVFSRWRRRV